MLHTQFARWLYGGKRPNRLARVMNWFWARVAGAGAAPNYVVTLEITGRKSGRVLALPLVVAWLDGQRYLVSMHGEGVNWVRNLRAAGGRAVLRHGERVPVQLEEVEVAKRAPILKAFLRAAPGARPHIHVDKDAALAEFEKIAADMPVFRVCVSELR